MDTVTSAYLPFAISKWLGNVAPMCSVTYTVIVNPLDSAE